MQTQYTRAPARACKLDSTLGPWWWPPLAQAGRRQGQLRQLYVMVLGWYCPPLRFLRAFLLQHYGSIESMLIRCWKSHPGMMACQGTDIVLQKECCWCLFRDEEWDTARANEWKIHFKGVLLTWTIMLLLIHTFEWQCIAGMKPRCRDHNSITT